MIPAGASPSDQAPPYAPRALSSLESPSLPEGCPTPAPRPERHPERDRANTPPTTRPEYEFDLENGPGGRFDEPSSLQLESRGVTSHVSTSRRTSRPPYSQAEFWAAQTAHKFSIAAKLRQAGRPDLAADLEDCHSTFTHTVCNSCGSQGRFPNRCDRHYCPECQPRLAHERKEAVEWWTKEVAQPKHVVLTARNVPDLSPYHFREFKLMFSRLRRTVLARKETFWWISNEPLPLNIPEDRRRYQFKRIRTFQAPTATHHTAVCSPWRGGFYSLEVTNERRGFHVHLHALIDSRSIHPVILSHFWGLASRGAGYIVKVKDVRDKGYLAEVTKYTVKGSQLAAWSPNQIRSFIEALDGVRTFGVFGSLYGKRTEFAEWLDSLREAKPLCDCGSCDLSYFTEAEWLAFDLKPNQVTKPRPPPPSHSTPELFPIHAPVDTHWSTSTN